MWHFGTILVGTQLLRWEAKVYDTPSCHGIAGGRVSKLFIGTGPGVTGAVANYNRGWDLGYANHPAVQAVLALFPAN